MTSEIASPPFGEVWIEMRMRLMVCAVGMVTSLRGGVD